MLKFAKNTLYPTLASALHVSSSRDDAPHVLEGEVDMIADVSTRRRARCFGVVTEMVIPPRGISPRLEADIHDGTGRLTLLWLGRESIAGIEPGTRLEVEGFVAQRGRSRVMYNPRYTIHGKKGEEL